MKNRRVLLKPIFFGAMVTIFLALPCAAVQYDLIIKGGKIVDGTGKLGYIGDIAIKGDMIVAVGRVDGTAKVVIDAAGLIVCPGFVDTHSHSDRDLLRFPLCDNFIMQGYTTGLSGPDGNSLAPTKTLTFGQYLLNLEKEKFALNVAQTVGLTTIRELVMGRDYKRYATPQEIAKMTPYVEEAMRNGAFGVSAGLDPGLREFASQAEHIECAKVAQKYGGLYHIHTRNHQNSWWAENMEEDNYGLYHGPKGEIITGRYHGLIEAVEIAHQANDIKLLYAHFTPAWIMPQPHPEWLQAAVAKATLEEIIYPARKKGQKVYFNIIACQYSRGWVQPVITSYFGESGRSARLSFPEWLRDMKKEEFLKKMKTREFRDKVKEFTLSGRFKFDMINPVTDPYWMDCYKIMKCKNKDYIGKTVGEIARKRSPDNIRKAVFDESLEVLFDMLIEDPETAWTLILDKREYPGALAEFVKDPGCSPTPDCSIVPASYEPSTALAEGKFSQGSGKDIGVKWVPGPNDYDQMPLYIDTYVNKRKVLSLEEAINRATYMPAHEILGLNDRGVLNPNTYADVVIFNLKTISAPEDYFHPNTPSPGIEYVLINGRIVYKDKKITGEKPGRVLRHSRER